MSVVTYDRIEILEYLKESVQRVRETAWMQPIESRAKILHIADQIADDTAQLESELVAAGYLPG
jgi:hypothetical protein